MKCSKCGGMMHDTDDGDGQRCWNCGRSPLPAPTFAELRADGLLNHYSQSREVTGKKGRGVESQPSNGDSNVLRRFRSR